MPNVFVLKDHLPPKKDGFEVEVHDKVYSFPSADELQQEDWELLTLVEKKNVVAMYKLANRWFKEDLGLKTVELQVLFEAWANFIQEQSGISVGE